MKKLHTLSATIVILLATACSTFAAEGVYFSAGAGIAKPTIEDSEAELKMERGLMIGGAVGYDMEKTRYEIELMRRTNDPDKITGGGAPDYSPQSGKVTTDTLMLNGYYNFSLGNNSGITPFVTGGIGVARTNIDNLDVDGGTTNGKSTDLAYQIGGGVSYAVTETVNLDARYRYLGVKDMSFEGAEATGKSHEVSLGVRVNF